MSTLQIEKLWRFFRNNYDMTAGLEELCKITKGENVLDLGANMGESAEIFCHYFRHVYSVDTWAEGELEQSKVEAGHEIPIEEIEKSFDIRMRMFGGRICKMKMHSLRATSRFPDDFFDLVYIDAGHDYQSVKSDIGYWLPKAKRYIGGHDYSNGIPVFKAVNEVFGNPHYLFLDGSWLINVEWLKKVEAK